MIKEEILYKASKTGTTVFYFVPNATKDMVPFLEEPAYLLFDSLNVPTAFYNYQSGSTELWKLENINDYNLNVLLSSVTTNYLTGYSISQTFDKILSPNERSAVEQKFNDNVTTTITGQTQNPINWQTYVLFNEHLIDDIFANIKLSRSYDTLDTLKIYNKPINSILQQEATTGIIFGKLEARQIVKDELGNNIRIPLRNVPIGIFNPSDDFKAPMSLDNNGDRFFMNIKESSETSQYFDTTAYTEDRKFLKSQSEFLTVPEKFKYITTTNENGEFVIYNAPIGAQTLVLEVDLFKQGLTKDEIMLNSFPFPTNDDSNIGEFPCYYYNQVPIDVVPTWGNNQSGYTEVNVGVNLDLRKWATYIFAPAAFGNEKLETTVARNVANTFKIQVKDMTNKKFAPKVLEIVQVPNDLDRAYGSKYLWYNEILSQRQQVEYFKYGCHVLKLPANLYDPNARKTNSGGLPVGSKGVWLAAYQFNSFVNINRCNRKTGGVRIGDNSFTLNHFDLNNYTSALPNAAPGSGIGKFPYEKPWTISYPEPYNITKKPIVQRFNVAAERLNQSPLILEEPPYSDGDLVGNLFDPNDTLSNVGGFGVQEFNGIHFPNQIAFVATKSYMYKYESRVNYNEQYSNGYEQYWTNTDQGPYSNNTNIIGLSKINNGEKYQRVECGYGYFMKYQDWTRVYRQESGADHTLYQDYNGIGTLGPGNYGNFYSPIAYRNNVHNIEDQSLGFAFENFLNSKINTGGLYIYRIVESGIDDIKVTENFVIPTFWELHFIPFYNRLYNFTLTNKGIIPIKITNTLNGSLKYGSGQFLPIGQSLIIQPGEVVYLPNSVDESSGGNPNFIVQGRVLRLPGNSGYDSTLNKYTEAVYHIRPVVSGNFGANNNFHNDGVSLNFDYDIVRSAKSSGFIRSKFQSQSDVSNVGIVNGICYVGNTDNTDDLIDVLLVEF